MTEEPASVSLCARWRGGSMRSLKAGEHQLLLPITSRPGRAHLGGAFVMAPWAGTLVDGAGVPEGLVAGSGSVDHGLAWRAHWTKVRDGVRSADLADHWNFGGVVTQSAFEDNDALTLALGLHATTRELRGSLGWHPWFRRSLTSGGAEVEVEIPAEAQMLTHAHGTDDVWTAPTARPWDHCFRTAHPVHLNWPGVGRLTVKHSGKYLVIYDTPTAVCVEPCTSVPGRLDRVVQPGSSLGLSIRLSWDPHRSR